MATKSFVLLVLDNDKSLLFTPTFILLLCKNIYYSEPATQETLSSTLVCIELIFKAATCAVT